MMDLKLDINDSFVFADRSFSSRTSHGSFSSASSSSTPCITPISGRSSPGHSGSIDFDSSFTLDMPVAPYDLTPPSSVASSYFTMDNKSAMDMEVMLDGQPTTPSRYSSLVSADLTSQYPPTFPQVTPHHHMASYAFGEPLDYSMFGFPTPANSVNGGTTVEMAEILRRDMDSPISFFDNNPSTLQSSPLIKREDSPLNFSAVRRLFAEEVQQRSTALQQRVLSQTPDSKEGIRKKKAVPRNVVIAHSGRFRCTEPGCFGKNFKRQEHLKRHIKTHSEDVEFYKCAFCKHSSKGRRDNWRQHMGLHARPQSKNSRVDHHPAAARLLEEELQRRKKRTVRAAAGQKMKIEAS